MLCLQNLVQIKKFQKKDLQRFDEEVPIWNISFVPKSLYISHAVSNCYGTEIEIWAGFRSIGNTEKKIGPILSNLWG